MEIQPSGILAGGGCRPSTVGRPHPKLVAPWFAAALLAGCGSIISTTVATVSPAAPATTTASSPCASAPAATAALAPSPSTGLRHLTVDAPMQVEAHHPFVVGVDVDYPIHIEAPTNVLIPGTGHFHIFIDRPPFPPGVHVPDIGLPGIIHTITKRVLIAGLDRGIHTITATLADGLDQTSGDVAAAAATIVAC